MKVYDFEEFVISDRYKTQVIDAFAERNPLYQNIRYQNEAIVFVHYKVHFYVFLKYVPKGEAVSKPSVAQSFDKVVENKRISQGEWVVESMHKMERKDSLALYPLIYAKDKQDEWFESLKQGIVANQIQPQVIKNEKETPSFLQKRL